MKKQTILLSLLTLAIAATVGCGNSTTAIPTFTKVAFLSNRTVTPPTSLFSSNLDGSNVTPIPFSTTSVWNLSTSADGKTVMFLSYAAAPASSVTTVGIWVGNSDGTGLKRLTISNAVYWARISPNGKKITYEDSTLHILVINVDGTGNLDLTPTLPTGMTQCYNPTFSADSAQIAFTCYGNTSVYGIYTVKADGTGLKTVETRSGKSNYVRYVWLTPDGKKVLFLGNFTNGSGIGSVNIDGTGEILLIPNFYEFIILNSHLFYGTGCGGAIFKANLDGTNPVQVDASSNNQDDLYGCN